MSEQLPELERIARTQAAERAAPRATRLDSLPHTCRCDCQCGFGFARPADEFHFGRPPCLQD